MRIPYAHICDYATVSREQKLSAIGIFSHIFAAQVPTIHPVLYLAFELEMTSVELGRAFSLEITLATEDGKNLMKVESTVTIEATSPGPMPIKLPQTMALLNLPLPQFGRYCFYIFVNGDLKREASFEVGRPPIDPRQPGATS